MTTGPAVNTDARVIAAGLAANVAVVRPPIITATGRAAPGYHAIVPVGAWVPFAFLPNVDYFDDPDLRPGCGFVGGRIAGIAPLLAPGTITSPANLLVKLRTLPESSEAILTELRSRAGLSSAPGALFAHVAWTDESVAIYCDRLRQNGDEARLGVAHQQGSLALRKAWLTAEWGLGIPSGVTPATASGVAAVGRALIDVIALIDHLAAPEGAGLAWPSHRETALAALLTALAHFLRHIQAAEATDDPVIAARKLNLAISWAKRILDAIGVFAVAADAQRKRWQRLTSMLDIGEIHDHVGGVAQKLDQVSRALEQLRCAELGRRLERTGWRPHIRRSLLRLGVVDRHQRLILLSRIRCDLIFALAVTGRLDRLYRLFPWLAAIHGAFLGCAGGVLGALASLFEAARAVEIGSDMKRRLTDAGQGAGTVIRLTPREASAVYAIPRHVVLAAGRNYAAGAALAAQVTSHVMVEAALEGKRFGDELSLETLRHGGLGYNDAAALKVHHTCDAVTMVHQGQPAFDVTDRDDDLIRYMGMTIVRHFGAAVRSIWPKNNQRDDFQIHRATIHSGLKPPKKKKNEGSDATASPWNELSKYSIQQALVRSMLETADIGADMDEPLRDAIEAVRADHANSGEVARAARLRDSPSRKTGEWLDHDEGQSAARDAKHEATNSDARGALLRDLIEDVRRWRGVDARNPQPAPRDDMLEDILLGRASLAQIKPVSDLFLPILWFAPLIDADRLAWIASGMPDQEIADGDQSLAARLKSWLMAVRLWSPAPFALPILRGRDDVIACHLFTGVSSVTSDLAHVR